MKTPLILHLAIPAPLYTHFDYLPPDNILVDQLQPGVRIRVPWRKGEAIGILLSVSQQLTVDPKKIEKSLSHFR